MIVNYIFLKSYKLLWSKKYNKQQGDTILKIIISTIIQI